MTRHAHATFRNQLTNQQNTAPARRIAQRASLLLLASLAGTAHGQTFTGAVAPPPGQPYGWYATADTGTPCGVPNNHIIVNNWGNQWCSSSGSIFPSGIVNLNGFSVANNDTTTVAGIIIPASSTLYASTSVQSFGTVSNAGTYIIARGAGALILSATTINNTGTFMDIGGGSGTQTGNLLINNSGIVTNNGGSFDLVAPTGQSFSGPCTLNNQVGGLVQSVVNGANIGYGGFNGWNINNSGTVAVDSGCSLTLQNCTLTSQPGATWTTGAGAGYFNIIDASIQGTFAGSTGASSLILNGTLSFPENTTFNFTGNGAYRWVGDTFNVAPGKTFTNAGRMWAIAPHTHPTIGTVINTGTYEHGGTIRLDNSTYTNAAGGVHNFYDGAFTTTGANQITNNGTMQAAQSASGQFAGVNLTNNSVIRNDSTTGGPQILMNAGTSVISSPSAQWIVTGTNNGMDFSSVSMQGMFNGSVSGNNTIRMNGVITFPENTTFNISGSGIYRWVGPTFNIAPGKTVTNAGRMWAIGPHTHPTTGTFINTGTFEHAGTLLLDNSTYTNAPGAVHNFYNGAFTTTGTNTITNNGTMQTTGGNGGVTFSGVNFINNSVIRNDSTNGTGLGFSGGTSITSTPAAQWIVSDGTSNGVDFNTISLLGTFNGSTIDSNDWRINGTLNITDNTTFNITGGGLSRWVCGAVTVAPGKTLTNTGRMGFLNGTTHTGTFVNNGTFDFYNGGTALGGTLVNNGSINWYAHNMSEGPSGGVFTNHGTINAPANTASNNAIDLPTTNDGVVNLGDATASASWGSTIFAMQQTSRGVVHLLNRTSTLYVPGNSQTISGGTIDGSGAVAISGLGTATFNNIFLNANRIDVPDGRIQLQGYANFTDSTRTGVLINGHGAANRTYIECWRNIDLNGTLEVNFAPGFSPTLGDTWTIVGAQSRTGTFDSVVVHGGNQDSLVNVSYTPTSAIITVTYAGCDGIDFNNDGLFPDTLDIDDFLAVFSGGPCSNSPNCADIDFNNDGLFPDTLDIDSLLSVFSGGACL